VREGADMRGTAAGLAAAIVTAGVLSGCSSAPPPPPSRRFATSLAKVGLYPKRGQAAETAWAKTVCNRIAIAVENAPQYTDLLYPAAVTGAEKRGYTAAQASAVVRAIIDDFCPQWKVLLRQQG
jgi:hypothetical protein